jgi:Glycosyl hydrolases family 43
MISVKMKIKNIGLQWILVAALFLFFNARADSEFHPGAVWRDTSGQPIQAHGGGILVHDGVYYWYGEDRTPGIRSAVSCYSSTNLLDWKREGVALWQTNLPSYYGWPTFVERPKVIFNPRTKKFVMWMHADQNGYHYACAGVAISDTPIGPFKFLKTFRPITNDFNFPDDANAQKKYGGTFRDMNLFVDDGKAYVFYSSEDNWTMYVARLNDDFTGPELPAIENKTWARILVHQQREGAAPFKWNGKYFLITSACTGWAPNAANYSVAENILGPWQTFGNPCVGPDAGTTFGAQSTFVLPMPGETNSFIFMADRWNPQNLPDSRYVWLPFTMKADGTFTVQWRDQWSFSVFPTR